MRKGIVNGEDNRAAARERTEEEQGAERKVKDVLKVDDIAAPDGEQESGAGRHKEQQIRPQLPEETI
jgi:hypothetical protein